MPTRRDVITSAASAATVALLPPRGAVGGPAAPAPPTLETRLFNVRDDVAPERVAAIVAAMKSLDRSPGVGGFLAGRNFIPDPFPTRFEWITMIQFDDLSARGNASAYRTYAGLRDELSALCRNAVECDLAAPVPPRFADAPGVGVRHTVMFDFKPEATAEARARNVAAIRAMGELPMVRHYVVERNPSFTPGSSRMEWQVIGDFGSAADYHAYSQAPVHLAIREDFKANTARVAFLDVEV